MNKIKIFTIEHKREDFIELQYLSFKKFLKDNFEYVVVENASIINDYESQRKINKKCEDLNIECISVKKDQELINEFDHNEDSINRNFKVFSQSSYHTASVANAYALQWCQKNIINNSEEHICGLHSDVFMIENDSFCSYLSDVDFWYIAQGGEKEQYAWPAFYIIKNKCPNKNEIKWWCGSINRIPVDTGGHSHYFLKDKNLISKQIISSYIPNDKNCDFQPSDYEIISFTESSPKSLLHYRSGSNWNRRSEEYHKNKTEWLRRKMRI